eukprot:SAG22_NODE_13914_length_391_cov_0.650685_1_plen_48_part_01
MVVWYRREVCDTSSESGRDATRQRAAQPPPAPADGPGRLGGAERGGCR